MWSEILAFMTVSGIVFEPWELEAIEAIDGLYMAEVAKAGKPDNPGKPAEED